MYWRPILGALAIVALAVAPARLQKPVAMDFHAGGNLIVLSQSGAVDAYDAIQREAPALVRHRAVRPSVGRHLGENLERRGDLRRRLLRKAERRPAIFGGREAARPLQHA